MPYKLTSIMLIISILFIRTFSSDSILANIYSMIAESNEKILGAGLMENGKIAYVTVLNIAGSLIIRKYNLTSESPQLMGEFQTATNHIVSDKFFLFKGYLIAYASSCSKYSVYNDSTYTYLGSRDLGLALMKFDYVKSKGIIIFTSIFGIIGYFHETNFPFPSTSNFLTISYPNQTTAIYGFTSKTQNYYAVISYHSDLVYIFSLSSLNFIFSYKMTGEQAIAADWHDTEDVMYVSTFCNPKLFIINITADFSVDVLLYPNANYTNIAYQIRYIQDTNTIFGFADYNSSTISIFGFSLDTLTLTEQILSIDSVFDFGYDWINSSQFYVFNQQNIYFYQFHSNQAFNTSGNTTSNFTPNANENSTITDEDQNFSDFSSFLNNSGNTTSNFTPNANENSTITDEDQNFSDFSSFLNNSGNTTSNFTPNANENSTITDEDQNFSDFSSFLQSKEHLNYQIFINATFQNSFLKFLNTVPGNRKLFRLLFSYFINFDDLWLYNYHLRQYDPIIQKIFDKIKQFEQQKWQLLHFEQIFEILGFNKSNYEELVYFKKPYTSPKVLRIQQDQPNGFFPNTPNFIFSNVILTFCFYLIVRLLIRFAFSKMFQKFFQEFKFWPFLFIMIIEGNLEYFGYLLTFDFLNLFALKFPHKLINLLAVLIGFVFLIYGCFIYLFIKSLSCKKSKVLFQNFKSSLIGVLMMMLCLNIRNFILGVLHMLAEGNYYIKIGYLLSVEVIFIILRILSIYSKGHYKISKQKAVVWYQVIFPSLIRIIMIGIFMLTYVEYQSPEIQFSPAFMSIQIKFIYCYLAVYFITIVANFISVTVEVFKDFIQKRMISNQKSPSVNLKSNDQRIDCLNKDQQVKDKNLTKQVGQIVDYIELEHNKPTDGPFHQQCEQSIQRPQNVQNRKKIKMKATKQKTLQNKKFFKIRFNKPKLKDLNLS